MDRQELVRQLISEEDQANAQYIVSQMDRDTWTKTLESIDSRLSVLGLRLSYRPWEGTSAVPVKF